MKRIDTWLDIQQYLAQAARMPLIPEENAEFVRVDFSEIAELREQLKKGAVSICVA
ncbi:MAG: hypothetical protein WC050_00410 [Candidatus Paceibacterota bacterium]